MNSIYLDHYLQPMKGILREQNSMPENFVKVNPCGQKIFDLQIVWHSKKQGLSHVYYA